MASDFSVDGAVDFVSYEWFDANHKSQDGQTTKTESKLGAILRRGTVIIVFIIDAGTRRITLALTRRVPILRLRP